jgi:3-methyladenine DNA glycosylase AlkC
LTDKKYPLMKDGLGSTAVDRLTEALVKADAKFPAAAFKRDARRGLDALELKQRVNHLIEVMDRHLPKRYPSALSLVKKAGRVFPPGGRKDPVASFAAWPLVDWVPHRGLDHPDRSLEALRSLTSLFSAEFAIRPFILADPVGVVDRLLGWARDDDHHVRRLVSEGTRPRLPWGQQLPVFMDDPDPVLRLLETLKDDDSEYVRRSVANNLNDIAKDHPDLAARTGRRWLKGASPERRRLVSHGLRTLVKKGHPGALKALGFTTDPDVSVSLAVTPRNLAIGESVELTLQLKSRSARAQKLVVDYVVHHLRSNGKQSAKVFKLKTLDLAPGQVVVIKKKHSFAPRSVRRYYAGDQMIEIQIGGQSMGRCPVTLTD